MKYKQLEGFYIKEIMIDKHVVSILLMYKNDLVLSFRLNIHTTIYSSVGKWKNLIIKYLTAKDTILSCTISGDFITIPHKNKYVRLRLFDKLNPAFRSYFITDTYEI